ncbi:MULTISPECIES: hypothetical protein [Clostridium]|uniref:Phage major capsid protein, HK97 family n=1 Tax=Clostridium frigoriphilum TaxID=443253 RepID=A0ABU7UK88_9CLOT|nr:hypothetical protein [Clostridium sp. DSM 17811]MBU3098379.1 hypothetical protein [Clostridium sp. DSM 17811]
MPVNVLEYATLFQQELDKQVVAGAVTGFMEGNAGLVSYSGGKTVKVPKISMDGLGDYDRNTGFKKGAATLEFEPFVMGQDRATSFSLDSQDVNETNFVASASNLMGEFQRVKVIPEVDAFRLSKIATLAIAKAGNCVSYGYTPIATDILTKIRADIAAVQDVIGSGVQLLVVMSILTKNVLGNSTEIVKQLTVGGISPVQAGIMTTGASIDLKVTMIDKCPIIEVPSALMKTAFVFADGSTNFGFKVADDAKNINWIIMAQNTAIAVCKTDTMRIFDPNTNQDADAWKLDYRKYHDLFIMDNKYVTLKVNIKEAAV